MTRSLKKNPFVANHLLRKINKLNTKAEKDIILNKYKNIFTLKNTYEYSNFLKTKIFLKK